MADNPIIQRTVPVHTVYQRPNVFGRLTSLVTDLDLTGSGELEGQVVINFPAMPETLTLVRTANYTNSGRTPVTPDGYHYYDHTDPLEIPIKFSIHAFDQEYCGPDGPVAILSTAAKLHALAMPILQSIGKNGSVGQAALATRQATTPTRSGDDASLSKTARDEIVPWRDRNTNFYFPPACRLDIIFIEHNNQKLGIRCDGFISRVSVTMKGPWLQGSKSDNRQLYNMPTSADFEFVFVQQPGYTNNVRNGELSGNNNRLISTSASQIFERLYNTADLSKELTYANLYGVTTSTILSHPFSRTPTP